MEYICKNKEIFNEIYNNNKLEDENEGIIQKLNKIIYKNYKNNEFDKIKKTKDELNFMMKYWKAVNKLYTVNNSYEMYNFVNRHKRQKINNE